MSKIFQFISEYNLFDLIPLDLFLHCMIGAILTYLGLHFNFKLSKIFIMLLVIAILKELNDFLFHLTTNPTEYLIDILVTFIYISIIYLIRKLKKILK